MASPKPLLPILLTLTGEQKGETPLPLADSGDAVGLRARKSRDCPFER